jgi:hypothetical protein
MIPITIVDCMSPFLLHICGVIADCIIHLPTIHFQYITFKVRFLYFPCLLHFINWNAQSSTMPLSISAIREYLPEQPADRAFVHRRIKIAIAHHRGFIFRSVGPPNQYNWVIWYVFMYFTPFLPNFFKPRLTYFSPWHTSVDATGTLDRARLPRLPCGLYDACLPIAWIRGLSKRWFV